MNRSMTSIAIVGIGYWGKNLVRVFSDIADVPVCVHTGSERNQRWLEQSYPEITLTTDYESILSDPTIDAVAIATPVSTHYKLARDALRHNKHVFVEKPLAESDSQAKDLVTLADERGLNLCVGYIFLHHPTITPLFDREESVEWGQFHWSKLGAFGENIFLDLVSHPVAVALELYDTGPTAVSVEQSVAVTERPDIVRSKIEFGQNRTFEIDINRVSQIENKSLQVLFEDGDFLYWSESGLYCFSEDKEEFEVVKQTEAEPLRVECESFVDTIEGDSTSRTSGRLGQNVNSVIEKMMSEV